MREAFYFLFLKRHHLNQILQRSEEQIFALAPDEASKKAGKDLANPSKWVSRGINELALWGECQGSGSKPYQTQVDLSAIAFKCSCPSRKFPCKHGLGLLLLESRNPDLFNDAEMPVWVADWINKRGEKEVKKLTAADKPVDEVAQAKRQEARTKKVSEGAVELLVWIKDIIRNGILSLPEKHAAYWDNMARRMVDAQAPGLASMIRELAATHFWKENWQPVFIEKLLQLYLLAESYQHLSQISEILQQDVLSRIGFTINQDELKTQVGIADNWLVLGKTIEAEGPLSVEQNWLYGLGSQRHALILQFYVKGQNLPFSIIPGTKIQAELVFFTSIIPYRAVIKTMGGIAGDMNSPVKGLSGWLEYTNLQCQFSSSLPFHSDIPVVIEKLKPMKMGNDWYLQDEEGYLGRIYPGFEQLWTLMALSGGAPLTMSLIKKDNDHLPIGIWSQHIYQPFK